MKRSFSPFWDYIWSNTERESLLLSCPALMAMCFQVVMEGLQARQAERDVAKWQQIEEEEAMEVVILSSDSHVAAAAEEEEQERLFLCPPFSDPLQHSRRVKDQVHVLLSCVETSELMHHIFADDMGVQRGAEEDQARSHSPLLHPAEQASSFSSAVSGTAGTKKKVQADDGDTPCSSSSPEVFWRAMRYAVECLWHVEEKGRKRTRDDGGDAEELPTSQDLLSTPRRTPSPLFLPYWRHCLYSSAFPPQGGEVLPSRMQGPPPRVVFSFAGDGEHHTMHHGIPLASISFCNTVRRSEEVLRWATSAALSASLDHIPATMKGLRAVLVLGNIVQGKGGAGPSGIATGRFTSPTTRLLGQPGDVGGSHHAFTKSAPTPSPPSSHSNSSSPSSPAQSSSTTAVITAEGLNFCMMPMPKQWWALLQTALHRLFLLSRTNRPVGGGDRLGTEGNARQGGGKEGVGGGGMDRNTSTITKPAIWQRLGILAMLEPTTSLYALPSKEEDLVGFSLLVRLAEIGLIYPMKVPSPTALAALSPGSPRSAVEALPRLQCFAIAPYLRHALQWNTPAPLCATSLLWAAKEENARREREERAARAEQEGICRRKKKRRTRNNREDDEDEEGDDGNQGGSRMGTLQQLRQQELDTIITETNYRLYVYSVSPDLLRLVGMFAEREEVVNGGALTCFRITRSSFVSALHKGLTAAEVLQFLSSKAHPSMAACYGETTLYASSSSSSSSFLPNGAHQETSEPLGYASTLVLPPSIVDQLLMWEREQHRVTFQPHMVLLQGLSLEQKELVRSILQDYGESHGLVHEEMGVMILQEEVYDRMLARYMPQD